jgi:hypothetical protein
VSPTTISARSKTVGKVIDRLEKDDFDWSAILHSSQRREIVDGRRRVAEFRAAR